MSKEKIEQAIQALQAGRLIIVADDDSREAEGDLIGLASKVTPETVNFMTKHARGLICVPLSAEIAEGLALGEMVQENTDFFGTAFTVSVDHLETTTGISAFDRAKTIQKLADAQSLASDFRKPGHIFPLVAKQGGVLVRRGHTEAAIDLAELAGDTPAAYICEILKADGRMARTPDLEAFAAEWDLPFITIEELSAYLLAAKKLPDAKVKLPTKYGTFDLSLYRDDQGADQLVLSMGDFSENESVLVRVHSECLTGDVFGSHRCDCGEQLALAMKEIAAAEKGAILYLRQEGRGIGLLNKLKAYQLQEQGLDTYDANTALGFLPDERNYQIAAELLNNQGIKKIRLLTNNPDKVTQLTDLGIEVVERIPLETTIYKENEAYLAVKKMKFHHLLSL